MADDTLTVEEAKLELLRWVAAAGAYPAEDFSEQAAETLDALIAAVRAEPKPFSIYPDANRHYSFTDPPKETPAMADDTLTVEQARAQALTYALALMRGRLPVEAPLNAAKIQQHIDVLLAWVATAPTPAMADDTPLSIYPDANRHYSFTDTPAVEHAKEALIDAIMSPPPYSDGLRPLIDTLIAAVRAENAQFKTEPRKLFGLPGKSGGDWIRGKCQRASFVSPACALDDPQCPTCQVAAEYDRSGSKLPKRRYTTLS